MQRVGQHFVANRAESKHKAFKRLQLELMENLGNVSDLLGPKDVVALAMDIEQFLKDNPEATGQDQTPLELFSEFLSNRDDIRTTQ